MLLRRVITASILAPLIILAVFQLSSSLFAVLWGVIILLAAWEWTDLADITKIYKKILFLILLALAMVAIHSWTWILEMGAQFLNWPEIRSYSGLIEWTVIGPILVWFVIMVLIRNKPQDLLALKIKARYKALLGWFVLLAAWMFMARLRMLYGAEMVFYFLLLIWAADIAAYFVGKKFGVIKLAPDISPGKTVQGMYAALAAAIVCALVLGLVYGFPPLIISDFALLSILSVLISIYGDLFFSYMKRMKGVKDSGTLLPGHGGLLDRIDSMIAAIPLFYAGVMLIGRMT
jgi:phosphatidate cytidylyltransferase